jgi:hypothetical protein
MPPQGLDKSHRQHRHPILAALAVTNTNLTPLEVEILDTQLDTFEQPKP